MGSDGGGGGALAAGHDPGGNLLRPTGTPHLPLWYTHHSLGIPDGSRYCYDYRHVHTFPKSYYWLVHQELFCLSYVLYILDGPDFISIQTGSVRVARFWRNLDFKEFLGGGYMLKKKKLLRCWGFQSIQIGLEEHPLMSLRLSFMSLRLSFNVSECIFDVFECILDVSKSIFEA